MKLIKKLFGQETTIRTYQDFWNWFLKHEQTFAEAVRQRKNIEKVFFDPLAQKFTELGEAIFFLAGMCDENTVELILTVDGHVEDLVFVEELVAQAPVIHGWRFVAHKPATENMGTIEMGGYQFSQQNISFAAIEYEEYPDQVEIIVTHPDLRDDNQGAIIHGCLIYLDNYLGELNFVCNIDLAKLATAADRDRKFVPISALPAYIRERQQGFVEKYDQTRHATDNDSYVSLTAELENGARSIAIMNETLLRWDSKPSHPWMAVITFGFDSDNGLPSDEIQTLLNTIEDDMLLQLVDSEGYLNVGRETSAGSRDIYFACRDFRLPARVMRATQRKYAEQFEIEYKIFKDKYWKCLEWTGIGG